MKIVAKRDMTADTRLFRIGGKKHYKVELSLEGDAKELGNISSVEYKLHPSFREPVREANNAENNFGTDIWTYGYFPIEAKIIREGKKDLIIQGQVKFE